MLNKILRMLAWPFKAEDEVQVEPASYTAGQRAYEGGLHKNPHRRGTIHYESWKRGYKDAESAYMMSW